MKNLRSGKAAIISDSDFLKIRRNIPQLKYKLLLDIAWYTGERWGAIRQLRIDDVYYQNLVRESITFRRSTRKRFPNRIAETRQVPVHPNLRESLQSYHPGDSVWLFPGENEQNPISWRYVYNILVTAVRKAGLGSKGISTHSTRRTFITKLHNNGVSTATIRQITGHKDYKSLELYINFDADQVRGAILSL